MDPDRYSLPRDTLSPHDTHINPATEEQEEIISKLQYSNVIVDSVAGSGKTTTNLHIALHYKYENILCLTYNAKLKLETRDRVSSLGITNLEVHSYHSFAVRYYISTAYTDTVLKEIVDDDTEPKKSFKYDLIILDESQDMTPLYYRLVQKICENNERRPKICLLGDRYQSIYKYNKADERFIIYADRLFDNINDFPWSRCTLSRSFRVTNQMAGFLNQCMLGYDRIFSAKSGTKVQYVICNNFAEMRTNDLYPLVLLKRYLSLGYRPNQIFILAPSIKSNNSPVRILENRIKIEIPEVMVFVSTSDEEKIDQKMIENKLVFSTFHQTKGLEREVVFVYSFDSSYYELYNQRASPEFCPNEIYVAATRSLEHLVLLHHYTNDYLPFLDINSIKEYSEYDKRCELKVSKSGDSYNRQVSVTRLTKHLPDEILSGCLEYFNTVKLRDNSVMISIPTTVEYTDDNKIQQKESVSEITGTALPMQYQYMLTGTIDIIKELPYDENITSYSDDSSQKSPKGHRTESTTDHNLHSIKNAIVNKIFTIDQLLYLANRWCSFKDGYLFKVKQIQIYDWLTIKNVIDATSRIQSLGIDVTTQFEKHVVADYNRSKQKVIISGFIDAVCSDCVFEFKCVGNLQTEHFIQLAIYAYLHEISTLPKITKYLPVVKQGTTTKGTQLCSIGDKILYQGQRRGVVLFVYKNGGYKVKNFNTGKVETVSDRAFIKKIGKKKEATNTIQEQVVYTTSEILQSYKPKYRYFLYNILSDELHQVNFDLERLDKMIGFIIYHKYGVKNDLSDEQFIEKMSILKV